MKKHHITALLASASILTGSLLSGCATSSTTTADPAHSSAVQTAPATKREIAALFHRWNASLATLDPDKVVANYATDAVLLPTVSNKPRTNHAELRDYFVTFLKKKPQGKIDRSIIKIKGDTASDVGIYTFTLHGADGKPKQVQARYSFLYQRQRDGGWLIAHHHSSVMPEPVASAR